MHVYYAYDIVLFYNVIYYNLLCLRQSVYHLKQLWYNEKKCSQ